MDPVPGIRRNIVIGGAMAGLLAFAAALVWTNVAAGNLHMNDLPFLRQEAHGGDGAFARGEPLHCSGIENMSPTAALAALEAEGFEVQMVHDLASDSKNVRTLPERAVLQDVGAASGSRTAIMFVMTPEHPRFQEGYLGSLPPQNC